MTQHQDPPPVVSRTTAILIAVGSFTALFVLIHLLGKLVECFSGGGGGSGSRIKLKAGKAEKRRKRPTAPAVGWEADKDKRA